MSSESVGGEGPSVEPADTHRLDTAAIRRLVESVICTRSGSVRQRDEDTWVVDLPPALAAYTTGSDTEATLVFETQDGGTSRFTDFGDDGPDATDAPTDDGIAVAPGTPFFQAVLEVAREGARATHVRLSDAPFPSATPPALDATGATIEPEGFIPTDQHRAVVFAFVVAVDGERSYPHEEFVTAAYTVDGDRHPALAERLTAHLGPLAAGVEPASVPDDVDETVTRLHDTAVADLRKRLAPVVDDHRADAAAALSERVDEIEQLYESRRSELDDRVESVESEIQKWREKRQSARKDETRRRYTSNLQDARQELEEVKAAVERRREELQAEERERLQTARDRHGVEVSVSTVGTTLVTYQTGDLELSVRVDGREGETTVPYTPASGVFDPVACENCCATLDAETPPGVCPDGEVVCGDCLATCADCGRLVCAGGDRAADCDYCGRPTCVDCGHGCSECGRATCDRHHATTADGVVACPVCETACTTCGDHRPVTALVGCVADGAFHCPDHTVACDGCGGTTCPDHRAECGVCAASLCPDDRVQSDTDETLCDDHAADCLVCEVVHRTAEVSGCVVCDGGVCEAAAVCESCGGQVCPDDERTCTDCGADICADDAADCTACGRSLCPDDTVACTHCSEPVCADDRRTCVHCDGVVCPADHGTCVVCGSGLCAADAADCVDCGDALCRDHATDCETCGHAICPDDTRLCSVCDDTQCSTHAADCVDCGDALCRDHATECKTCDHAVCSDDTRLCSVCNDTQCSAHAADCVDCGDTLCRDHAMDCETCDDAVCSDDTRLCSVCDDTQCSAHAADCVDCGDTLCRDHATWCETCGEATCADDTVRCETCDEPTCPTHRSVCRACGDPTCPDHSETTAYEGVSLCLTHTETAAASVPFVDAPVLDEHTAPCADCGATNAAEELTDGRCWTCERLRDGETVDSPPPYVDEDLATGAVAVNGEYTVVRWLGLMSVVTVVYDAETGDEVNRERGGPVARLREVFR